MQNPLRLFEAAHGDRLACDTRDHVERARCTCVFGAPCVRLTSQRRLFVADQGLARSRRSDAGRIRRTGVSPRH